jgi:threonylcarbamoyladenosine tRNA methylthiotransferase MtaB
LTPHSATVCFETLGCKLNFAETAAIAQSVESKGFSVVTFDQKADYYVINTCSVTENADKKFWLSRRLI